MTAKKSWSEISADLERLLAKVGKSFSDFLPLSDELREKQDKRFETKLKDYFKKQGLNGD